MKVVELTFIIVGCVGYLAGGIPCAAQVAFGPMTAQMHGIITNKASTSEELRQALSRLGPVTEPAVFWTRIADDERFTLLHRTRAVFALLRRHSFSCPTVRELRQKLSPGKWLQNSPIRKVDFDSSFRYPTHEGERAFEVLVLYGPPVYIVIRGDADPSVFASLLRGDAGGASKPDFEISNIFYGDDYDAWFYAPGGRDIPSEKEKRR